MKIHFIGGGNIAAGFIDGLLSEAFTAEQITITEPNQARRDWLKKTYSVQTYTENQHHHLSAEVVVLAVKPQTVQVVAQQLRQGLSQFKPLLISLAAGVKLSQLRNWIGAETPLLRAMPNTPIAVAQGMIALCSDHVLAASHKQQAEQLMGAVGRLLWLDQESKIDAITAVSGSGPAYFFAFMECLQQGAEALGLTADEAFLLTQQTALGAACLASRGNQDFSLLKQQVTSPQGTTAAALERLEQGKFRELVVSSVKAAHDRSMELGMDPKGQSGAGLDKLVKRP